MKRGNTPRKSNDYVQTLCTVVDDNPDRFFSTENKNGSSTKWCNNSCIISRLLVRWTCLFEKTLAVQPTERNRLDMREKQADFAQWLTKECLEKFRLYIYKTNSNI